jgi:hypothetical protein
VGQFNVIETGAVEVTDAGTRGRMVIPRLGGAIGLAILYVAGFVVVNAHSAAFFPISAELVRAQYVAAAALWIFLTALPALYLGVAWYSYEGGSVWRLPDRVPRRIRGPATVVVYCLIGATGYALYTWPLFFFGVSNAWSWSSLWY